MSLYRFIPGIRIIIAVLIANQPGWQPTCAFAQTGSFQQSRLAQAFNKSRFVIQSSPEAATELRTLRSRNRIPEDQRVIADVLRIRGAYGDELVPVGVGHWQQVGFALDVVVSQFSETGLQNYQQALDPIASEQLRQAIENRNTDLLHRIVQESFHTQAAETALHRLAEAAWRNGRTDLARHYWTQLIPLRPNPNGTTLVSARRFARSQTGQTDILLKLIQCRLANGDREYARQAWTALVLSFPESADKFNFDRRLQEFSNPNEEIRARTVGPEWSVDIPIFTASSAQPQIAFTQEQRFAQEPIAAKFFLNTGNEVLGFNTANGKPIWPLSEDDDDHKIFLRPGSSDRNRSAGNLSSCVAEGNRLIAGFGRSVACLDVGRAEGKLLWQYPESCPTCVPEDLLVSSSPIIFEGNVFLVVRDGIDQTRSTLVSFNLETGQRNWSRSIAIRLASSSTTSQFFELPDSVAHGQNAIFVMTSDGLLACLSKSRGDIRWIRDLSIPATPGLEVEPNSKWQIWYRNGKLICFDNRSNRAAAFDADSGTLIWISQQLAGIREFVGEREGVLIFRGRSLVGLNNNTGTIRWRHDSIDRDFAIVMHARQIGILTTHESIVMDVASGQLLQSRYLQTRGKINENSSFLEADGRSLAVTVSGGNVALNSLKSGQSNQTLNDREAY